MIFERDCLVRGHMRGGLLQERAAVMGSMTWKWECDRAVGYAGTVAGGGGVGSRDGVRHRSNGSSMYSRPELGQQ